MLFCARDSLTILASFNLPAKMSQYLQEDHSVSRKVADVSSQLILPCSVQFISTPLYLVGSHLYNVPVANATDRLAFTASKYWSHLPSPPEVLLTQSLPPTSLWYATAVTLIRRSTVAARCARIFPAFGLVSVSLSITIIYHFLTIS